MSALRLWAPLSASQSRGASPLLFPTFLSLMRSQCDSPHDSIQTLLPQRTERSQPPHWSIPAGVFFTQWLEGRGWRWKFGTQRQISNRGGLCCQVAHTRQRGVRWPLTWPLLRENRWAERPKYPKNERNRQTWLEERNGLEEGEIVGGRHETKCSEIGQPVSHFSC